MLGQAVSMLIPNVVGVRVVGRLPEGTTTTDAVLTVTERLRAYGVVGKFVEYFGPGLDHLALTDRATLSNMSPEYGATMGFFPIDDRTLEFLGTTGRDPDQVELVEAYAKEQGLWREAEEPVLPKPSKSICLMSNLASPGRFAPINGHLWGRFQRVIKTQ